MSKKQAFNPYLPSWEFVPDGEPHVFDGRVYITTETYSVWEIMCAGPLISMIWGTGDMRESYTKEMRIPEILTVKDASTPRM